MWKIWKEEVKKIASRKIICLGLLLMMIFISWRLVAERSNYFVVIDGQAFYGQEAVEKDKALTAQYAGILTEEKVRLIYDAYGFNYFDPQQPAHNRNFCSRFVTEKMTNAKQIGIEDPAAIQFFQGADWEKNAAPLLNGDIQFDYVYGWDDLKETHSFMVSMALFIVFIIGLAPVFAEEYTLKTADILLTTQRGKKSGIWMKITAALFYTAVVYCVFTLYIWLIYFIVYGTQGLNASPALIGVSSFGYCPATISGFLLYEAALGLASVLLLTCISLAVSALCKNAFLAVVVSMAVFFVPYVWMNILAVMLSPFLHTELIKAVSHCMTSMPFYLSMNWGFAFSQKQTALHLAIALAAGAGGILFGYRAYRNYQG